MIKKHVNVGKWRAFVEKDEDGYYAALVPAIPGCHTQARNLTELKRRLNEAIALCASVDKNLVGVYGP